MDSTSPEGGYAGPDSETAAAKVALGLEPKSGSKKGSDK